MTTQRAEALRLWDIATRAASKDVLGYEAPMNQELMSDLEKDSVFRLIALARASAAPQEPPHGWEVWGGPKNGAPIGFYGYARTIAEANDLMGRHEFWEWKTVPVYLSAPQPQASPQEPPHKYAVDPIRADESLALAEKIMDRVVATGSAYLKLELVDPTAPQPPTDTSDDVRGKRIADGEVQFFTPTDFAQRIESLGNQLQDALQSVDIWRHIAQENYALYRRKCDPQEARYPIEGACDALFKSYKTTGKFKSVFCSQCGAEFPGNFHGYSSCESHAEISFPGEDKGACPVCGCEELDRRNLWTCQCAAAIRALRTTSEK